MKTTLDIIYFNPATESVKLHWAVTGMLARAYGARHAYSVLLDDGAIDVYFTDTSFQARVGSFSKVIWVDTRPAIMKANDNLPFILVSNTIGADTIRLILNKQLTDKSLASLYYSVLLTLNETSLYKSINTGVWNEYKKMYLGLESEGFCECKDCQEEREEKEIAALILPIVNLLKKTIREQKEGKKEPESCECSRDEYCSCQP
jgi:hypothetical protein